jgi:hypothetical protein
MVILAFTFKKCPYKISNNYDVYMWQKFIHDLDKSCPLDDVRVTINNNLNFVIVIIFMTIT